MRLVSSENVEPPLGRVINKKNPAKRAGLSVNQVKSSCCAVQGEVPTLVVPFGQSVLFHRAPDRIDLVRSASVRFASVRFEPERFALVRIASVRFASVRYVPDRFALARFASVRFALVRFAPDIFALIRLVPIMTASFRFALVRLEPLRFA